MVRAFTGSARPLRTAAALAAAATLAACGGGDGGGRMTAHAEGYAVVADTTAAFAQAPDFDERVASTVAVALAYWGGTWAQLDGKTITFVDDPAVDCGGRPSLGCYDGDVRLTTRDPGLGTFPCVEGTVLVHEIGHIALGDRLHQDPRWMEMDAVAHALDGRVGYTDSGVTTCTTYPSVWRHPLGTP